MCVCEDKIPRGEFRCQSSNNNKNQTELCLRLCSSLFSFNSHNAQTDTHKVTHTHTITQTNGETDRKRHTHTHTHTHCLLLVDAVYVCFLATCWHNGALRLRAITAIDTTTSWNEHQRKPWYTCHPSSIQSLTTSAIFKFQL